MNANRQLDDGRRENSPIGHLVTERRTPPAIRTGVLWVVIPYTTLELTKAALRHAAVCTDLEVHVCLVDIQTVPFPAPVDDPPVNREFSERRLEDLLRGSGLRGKAALVYTRDWLESFRKVLEPNSLIILATKKRWWPTREVKLARALQNAGHHVMLLPVER
jgi:hypothetical protein